MRNCDSFVCGVYLLSRLFAKSIVKPIEMLAKNMDREELATGYKELTPFLNTIQKQHRDIVKSSNMRQEFTANVSHELKTPLTSISGYSELIAGGMAKGEDAVRFAEIQKNSSRL
ncbi:MAG: histidine kinase dimerization/phospho-acceptor domain-containing protein [Clostridium sp.]